MPEAFGEIDLAFVAEAWTEFAVFRFDADEAPIDSAGVELVVVEGEAAADKVAIAAFGVDIETDAPEFFAGFRFEGRYGSPRS